MARIADVRVRILRAPLSEPIRMSFASLQARHMALIEVEAEDGSIGYGESWINHPPWASRERVATIREGLAPLLIGSELKSVRTVVERFHSRLGPLARQSGAPGPLWQAVSGAEIACWDLLGKLEGSSIAELLGGPVRRSVTAYASGLEPDNVEELARLCVEEGFRAAKCRLGFGLDTDLATVEAAAAILGEGRQLFADANQAWSLEEAAETLPALRRAGVSWVEEPVAGNRLSDLEALFGLTGTPIATGENLYGCQEFVPYAHSQGVAVLQPDVSKVGGILEMDAICSLATDTEKAVMPHWYGGAVALAATLQVAASHAVIECLELDVRENPFRDSILKETFEVRNGVIAVPDGPGLGIHLDRSAIESYEVHTP